MTRTPHTRASATAVLFPGQGSQAEGMREEVERDAPEVLDTLADFMDDDPFERLEDGTRFVQPAVFCASIASWYAMQHVVRPVALAGHSFGDITALVAAGALSLRDGLRLVVARGEITSAFADGDGMLAVLKLDTDTVERIANDHGLAVANYNAPGQTVLAGPQDALQSATDDVWDAAGLPVALSVQGAFHSDAQARAVAPFRRILETVDFGSPRIPVIACSTAAPFEDPVRELADALVRPVRWVDVLVQLHDRGVSEFVEAAPGDVLCGLVERTLPGAHARPMRELMATQSAS